MKTIYSKERTRSGFEDSVLANLQKREVMYEYEKHKLPYSIPRNYIPDLKIGSIFVELKGFLTVEDMAKMKAVKECNPGKDIRFVFQNAYASVQGARVRKKCGTKMKCWEWAENHGFPWANKEIPEEWLTPKQKK